MGVNMVKSIKLFFTTFISIGTLVFGTLVQGKEITLIVPQLTDAKTLSPGFAADTGGYHPTSNIYSHLVVMDWGILEGTSAYGDLAKSWKYSDDAKSVTFYLHENVKWHDGKNLTSHDVKFTFDTIMDKKYPFAKYLSNVKKISTPDDYTLVIDLKKPDVAFVAMQAQAAGWTGKIYPKHLWENQDGFDKGPYVNNPIGSGPFKFKNWVRGSYVELEANKEYFRGKPEIDRLIFKAVSDKNVARAEFDAGNFPYLSFSYAPPLAEIVALKKDPNIEVIMNQSHYGRDIQLNLRREPLNKLKVRKAIAYAIDRPKMSKLAFFGLWKPAYYAIVDTQKKWRNEDAKFPSHNKELAEKLLDEAGYPRKSDGWRFDISVTGPSYQGCVEIAEVLVQQLQDIGINARWDKYDNSAWYTKMTKHDFDISVYFTRFAPDPDAYREHFGTNGARNFMGFSNSEFDNLAEEGITLTKFEDRKKNYQKMQKILVDNIPYIQLFNTLQASLIRPGWTGFNVQPSGFNKSFTWFGYFAVKPPK